MTEILHITLDDGRSRVALELDNHKHILIDKEIDQFINDRGYRAYDRNSNAIYTPFEDKILSSRLVFDSVDVEPILQYEHTPIFRGVNMLIAGTQAGKTTLVNKIADFAYDQEVTTLNEKLKESDVGSSSISTSRYHLPLAVTSFLTSDRDLFILDSLRFLAFEKSATSATGEKGANMGLFVPFADLDAIFRYFGKAAIFTINLMSLTPAAEEFFVNGMNSSVSSVITLSNFIPETISRVLNERNKINNNRIKPTSSKFTIS